VSGAIILTFGLSFHHNILVENLCAAIAAKWLMPWWYYILSGFVCGFIMTIATRPNTPLWVSSLCVAAFILGKFNHCIADWFYAPNLLLWICVVLGNFIGGLAAVPKENKI
jgi:formate/nitrite transporter FocA (FNT family)